jgi:hypothetical protein
MATPITAVAFHPEAPLEAFASMMRTMKSGESSLRYIDCKKVDMTDFGMLRLIPSGENPGDMAIYVHPSYVAWMLRADDRKQVGFLPA